eukprot:Skav210009  [mRNA]  locus=scaffold1212:16785:17881:- [translate_table: standard]
MAGLERRLAGSAGSPSLERILDATKVMEKEKAAASKPEVAPQTANLRYYDGKLTGLLTRTKTTGAGKRVRELPIFVGAGAYIHENDWLGTGCKLLGEIRPEGKVYVFPEGALVHQKCTDAPMKYYEATAISATVFSVLDDESGDMLFAQGWERFWTEGSGRSTLSSGLAALGVSQQDRNILGRWCPEGSDQYMRTFGAAVHKLQIQFAQCVRQKGSSRLDGGLPGYGPEGGCEGSPQLEAQDHQARWVANWAAQRGLFGGDDDVPVGQEAETAAGPNPALAAASPSRKGVQSSSGESSDGEDVAAKKRKTMDNLSKEREGKVVAVYTRARRGTLHGLDGEA